MLPREMSYMAWMSHDGPQLFFWFCFIVVVVFRDTTRPDSVVSGSNPKLGGLALLVRLRLSGAQIAGFRIDMDLSIGGGRDSLAIGWLEGQPDGWVETRPCSVGTDVQTE